MSDKLRIMQMIKDGTISPEEGLDLLEALGSTEASRPPREFAPGLPSDDEDFQGDEEDTCCDTGRRPRWLHIKVHDPESGKNVKIRIPIALAKFAGKFVPKEARQEMSAQGIDLDINGILEALEREGQQDLVVVNESGGKVVKIFTR